MFETISEVTLQALQTVIIVAIPLIAAFFAQYLSKKAKEVDEKTKTEESKRCLNNLSESVIYAIAFVAQTYVNGLKQSNTFSVENQKMAIREALRVTKAMLTKETIDFINENFTEIDAYITQMIEAKINQSKQVSVEPGLYDL